MWFYFLMGALFVFLGFGIHVMKWYFLISGYNTMSREKKAKVDTKGLGRLMGGYLYLNGGIAFLMGVLVGLGFKPSMIPMLVIFGCSTVFLLIRAQRFDGNLYDESGKMRPGAGKQLALIAGLLMVVLLFVSVLMVFSSQATKVTVLEDGLQIHGIYGVVIDWDSIKQITLNENLPEIQRRTNGSALGANLKGHFSTRELGGVRLFVNTKRPPYIFLETEEGWVIFNMKNAEETQEVFDQLK